jgi:hypothetical protein
LFILVVKVAPVATHVPIEKLGGTLLGFLKRAQGTRGGNDATQWETHMHFLM